MRNLMHLLVCLHFTFLGIYSYICNNLKRDEREREKFLQLSRDSS